MSADNVLFGHSSHAALPVCALNDPGKHAEHTPPSGPVYPVLHVHVVDVLAPRATEYELAGHAEHVPAAVAPIVDRYVPAEQSELSLGFLQDEGTDARLLQGFTHIHAVTGCLGLNHQSRGGGKAA